MSAPDDTPGSAPAAGSAPADDERCLAVLTLLHDGRPVPAELAAWARAHVEAHAKCSAAWAELVEQSAALAASTRRTARPDFTRRVTAAWASGAGGRATSGDVLPFVRRLAVAAGLALALTLFIEMAGPSDVQADSALQRERHAADHFMRGAAGAQDIEAGLRARLEDPDFGRYSSGSGR